MIQPLRWAPLPSMLLAAVLTFSLTVFSKAQVQPVVKDTSVALVLARAYSLQQVNPNEAARYFEQAITLDSTNIQTRRDLGYLYISLRKMEQSLEQFQAAERLKSSDTIKLQIAYILAGLNRNAAAEIVFHELVSSPDKEIRDRANTQLAAGTTANPPSMVPLLSNWWTHIYIVPFYDTRWSTTFIQSYVQRGYYLNDLQNLSGYGIVAYSGDARSSGGAAPVIFSDNSLLFGVGVQYKPITGLSLNAQQGIAIDLIERPSSSRVREDFRAVANYGYGIYPPFAFHNNVQSPLYPFMDMYSSFGYYSRYTNGIGYVQARAGLRTLEVSRTALDVYLRGDLVFDTDHLYYNNEIAGGLGARLTPNINWNLYVIGEFRWAKYINDPDPPYPFYYNTFRLLLIYDKLF
jgi:hypothetical protein